MASMMFLFPPKVEKGKKNQMLSEYFAALTVQCSLVIGSISGIVITVKMTVEVFRFCTVAQP